jgi:Ca2+:H+ antiporter
LPLLFVPVALWLDHMPQVSAPVVFFVSAATIVPVARLITKSTEELAEHTGDSMGGLINAIFGNTPELIIALLALKAGLHELVAASIVGAILFNLLLVLGSCLLVGGWRRHTLDFNAVATSMYSSMMFIAVMSLALPSIYRQVLSGGAVSPHSEYINIVFALVLLALFGLYLLFMIRTHPEIFASAIRAEPPPPETKRWSVRQCVGSLLLASVIAALLSEVLVGAVEETGDKLGLSASFLGIVLLASVGGMAEGMSALSMARKGRLDLALSIALGSCILIALFIAPALVFASYMVGRPFQLTFNIAGVALLFMAVLIAAVVVSGGSGHWYKGVQLITVYLMIALLLYALPQ